MATLKEEEPFAVVVHTENLSKMCSFCFGFASEKKPLTKCRGCRLIYYCNEKCQKGDRPSHKKECCLLKRAMDSSGELPGPIVRLVARILSKSETTLAQKAFNGRTWDSLDDSFDLTEDCKNTVHDTIPKAIVKFMKPMKSVSLDEARKALRKVIAHQITIYDAEGLANLGLGIYLGLSIHKHSCVPNSQLLFSGTKATLRSFDPDTTTYSPDLEFSYTWMFPWARNRRDIFIWRNLIPCGCSLCVDENHIFNRMGSSCRVDCCLNAAGILDENSTGPYKCNKCGEASQVTVKEVNRAETKIQNFLNQKKDPKYIFDFKEAKRIVYESEKVLSVCNSDFMRLCSGLKVMPTVEEKATQEDYHIISLQLEDKELKGMRYYLPETDIRFVGILVERAGSKLVYYVEDDFDVDGALEVAMKAYGEHHPVFISFKTLFEALRKVNVVRRELLFRKAARHPW